MGDQGLEAWEQECTGSDYRRISWVDPTLERTDLYVSLRDGEPHARILSSSFARWCCAEGVCRSAELREERLDTYFYRPSECSGPIGGDCRPPHH